MQISTFAESIRTILEKESNQNQVLDIITFTESVSGLGITLYPVQRFILKVFYGMKLSDELDEPIVVTDNFNEHILNTFTSEIDFFNFLYSQKRINMSYENYKTALENDTLNITEIDLICGRRASKTTMVAIISCYSLYLLLSINDPHKHFGVLRTDPIGICLVSNKADNAHKTYKAITDLIRGSKFFERSIGQDEYGAGGVYWLKTEQYKKEELEGIAHSNPGNIAITSSAANSGVRGWSNLISIIDEVAH